MGKGANQALPSPRSARQIPPLSPARVVKLADTRVLEALAARLAGSSPVPGTMLRPAQAGLRMAGPVFAAERPHLSES
jgi:hypothetical protein